MRFLQPFRLEEWAFCELLLMGASQVNLYNNKEPNNQDLGFRWGQGFQSIFGISPIEWISTSQNTVKRKKKKTTIF